MKTRATKRCIVSVDQGTSSTKAVVVDEQGIVQLTVHQPVTQTHPAPGHVEQDAEEIASSVIALLDKAANSLEPGCEIVGVGLSTQRESAVVWDRSTGQPLGPMLGWQDRRTLTAAEQMRTEGVDAEVRMRSGLPLDPMFSALKISWLLDEVDPERTRATNGDIAVGTVDSWLVAKLTGEHRIEAGNASRTQLMNINSVGWDSHLTELFNVPDACLPQIARSDAPTGPIQTGRLAGVPILGILGDSHAALYAHGVRSPGSIKATYGTGSSIMGLVEDPAAAGGGLVSTVAWQTDSTAYACEGNILSTGATLVWLANLLGSSPDELMELAKARSLEDGAKNTVDLVPAFAGLGAPWWDDQAVAILGGMDLGTDRAALAQAAADSLVLQVEDVVAVFDQAGTPCTQMLVDGGPANNDWLMQRQSDLSQRDVVRRSETGLSALGAAHLAGVTAGLVDPTQMLPALASSETFHPQLDAAAATSRINRWHTAVQRSRRTQSPTVRPE